MEFIQLPNAGRRSLATGLHLNVGSCWLRDKDRSLPLVVEASGGYGAGSGR